PAWVTGELLVGGDGVSDGYWRQPALTGEKFIPDPERPGSRLYRTGDLARRRPDGQLEFVGRSDHQVKIRGHRVELGEVEQALAQLPGVGEAVVLAPEDQFGDRRLVAYVVPQADAQLEPGQLQKAAAGTLPASMAPAAVQLLRAFPLTANGKIDRRALLALAHKPAAHGPGTHGEAQAPEEVSTPNQPHHGNSSSPAHVSVPQDENALEFIVADVWRELFALPVVRETDDFFALGGTSLTAVRMFALLRRKMSFDLPLAALFEAPRLADFSALIRRNLHVGGGTGRSMRLPSSGSNTHLRHRTWSPLVTICRGDARRNALFCVHGAGGNVFNFKALSQALGPARAVFGLQPQGVDGHLAVLGSIEAMAAQYVAAIRKVDAAGPYRLMGYSAGGVIALEMAQQLKRAGAEVSLLAMIDTLTPAAALRTPSVLRKLWLARSWRFDFALERYRHHVAGKSRQDDCALIEEKLRRGEWLAPELAELHLFNRVLEAQNKYAPQRYEDGMVLFKARDATTQYLQAGPHMGWDAYVGGGIRVFSIPGSHNSVMQGEGLSQLASLLEAELVRLDNSGGDAGLTRSRTGGLDENPLQSRIQAPAGRGLASDICMSAGGVSEG
ncbi:MAG: polyketide synthase-like protein, partial [Polaromonas sp.]|nr:polyketide synthase-like protein [Polaromonas sp.]